jgi:hypothetical protein
MLAKLKASLLSLVDAINVAAEPFEPFTRGLEIGPGETLTPSRLDEMAGYSDQHLSGFLSEGGKFYVYSIPNDMGDLCIWQGVYTAMRCLEAKATGQGNGKAVTALYGLLNFSDGILLRGYAPDRYDGTVYQIDQGKAGQYWHGQDGALRREDASLDSLAGWLFGMACAIKYLDLGEDTKKQIGRYAERFLAAGCRLLNRDGSMTRHGDCRPGFFQAPVRNLAATAVARLAYLANGNGKWLELAQKYRHEFERTETHVLWKHGFYNDNMAVLIGAAYCMMTFPSDPGHQEALRGLRILADKQRKHGNALLTALCRLLGAPLSARQEQIAEQVLLEFSPRLTSPNGKGPAIQRNSQDPAVKKVEWGGKMYAAQPLPIWKRPPQDFHWQRNPYQLDDGTEHRHNFLDFLIAYWARRAA